jgi:hypothetical protein
MHEKSITYGAFAGSGRGAEYAQEDTMLWTLITVLAIGLTIANHRRRYSAVVVEVDGRKQLERVSPPDPKDLAAFDFMIWVGWGVVSLVLLMWRLA